MDHPHGARDGGQSPSVRRVAARFADGWNTHGAFGLPYAEILASTRRQNDELDAACRSHGRDPHALRRGLLLFGALDPWESDVSVDRVVGDFRAAGVEDFVLSWPNGPEMRVREQVARVVARLASRLRVET